MNEKVNIRVEKPSSLQRVDSQEDEEEAMLFEVAKSSSKVQPGVEELEEPAVYTEKSSPDNSEDEDKLIQELLEKEKREAERRKKLAAFRRRRKCINCLRSVVCFRDDENVFDKE